MTTPYDSRPWLCFYPSGVPTDVDVPDVPLTRLLDDAADRFRATPLWPSSGGA